MTLGRTHMHATEDTFLDVLEQRGHLAYGHTGEERIESYFIVEQPETPTAMVEGVYGHRLDDDRFRITDVWETMGDDKRWQGRATDVTPLTDYEPPTPVDSEAVSLFHRINVRPKLEFEKSPEVDTHVGDRETIKRIM